MTGFTLFEKILLGAVPVIFAITVHEVAHGWVANRLGDPTARMLGRLTLNPLKHIDPVGTVILPAILLSLGGFVFGWAKPVPVDWRNLRHPKRDMALVAAAGPTANFVMLIGWALVGAFAAQGGSAAIAGPLYFMAAIGILINAVLMVLNLLPLPPLDGSRVVAALLPPELERPYSRLERWGLLILLVLMFSGVLSWLLGPPVRGLIEAVSVLFNLP
ncbi:MAG TPA: site-2 protease family protein [Gammaproteobacteria bacterium]